METYRHLDVRGEPQTAHVALNSSYSFLPPDLVIVVISLSSLQLFEWIHRRRIAPKFPSYRALPFRDRFDWDRRAVNVAFQVLQTLFNTYVILFDPAMEDVLYGYSPIAHLGFLVIVSFYIYDSIGLVMHPSPPSSATGWLVHHAIAEALLLYASYKRSCAFPAAIFLVSAAGHIPNEVRWFLAASNTKNQTVLNASLVLCVVVAIFAMGLPPPYLLARAASQMEVSIHTVLFSRMRLYCLFVFTLVYVPHAIIILYQVRRLYLHWNKPAKPFRAKRVD